MDNETKNLHPIEVLIEELKCEDLFRRVLSVKNLNTIAIALGPKQTREELLPHLLELFDDDNEVLLALAESLRYLLHSIGGKKYAFSLFDLLEHLLQIDEKSIRTTTLESFQLILDQASSPSFSKVVLDLIKRLCTSDKVPAKIGAAYLIPYSLDKSHEKKLYIDQFKLLLLCNHPQVRIAAAENLKALVKHEQLIVELLNIATVDQEDSIRLLALEALLECGSVKGLVTSVIALFEDDYWKVKQKLAENLASVSKFINGRFDMLLEYFTKITRDKEVEVRLALCRNASDVFRIVPKKDIEQYVTAMVVLGNDLLQVKIALALEINKIWRYIGKNEQLSALIQSLISSYSSQVSLNLLQNIEKLQENDSNFSEIVRIQAGLLLKDKSWRVRQSLANYLKYAMEALDEKVFVEYFKGILFELIVDSAFTVRETTAGVVYDLVVHMGTQWFEENILEDLLGLQYTKTYIKRMAYLNIAKLVFKECLGRNSADRIEKSIFFMLDDPVCNVKVYALKALDAVYHLAGTDKQQAISSSLSILQNDEDIEIRNLVAQFR